MNCPRCGHPTKYHKSDIHALCLDADTGTYFDCGLTEAESLRAAQRQAAAVRLRERVEYGDWLRGEENFAGAANVATQITMYEQALHDTGILAPGETAAKLLAEWPSK